MKTAVVTGAAGQDGSYLCELLLGEGYHVFALVRPTGRGYPNLHKCLGKERFDLVEGDILDPATRIDLIRSQVDEFYHLAALTHVGQSFNNPTLFMETNIVATAHLLDLLRHYAPKTKFYFAATSEMLPTTNEPQDITGALGANSPYAASKVAAHLLVENARHAHGLFAVSGIAFNHESRRRPVAFVTQKIVDGVRRFVSTGKPVTLADLTPKRDWHHAKDTVEGMWLSLQAKDPATYVFASGVSRSVGDFARTVCTYFDVPWQDAIRVDPGLARPQDVKALCGDPSGAERLLGWRRSYSFDALVEDMCR